MTDAKPIQLGRTTRMNYSRVNEALKMPNLIEVQKKSYEWFVNEGLKEVFKNANDISDHTGTLLLEFVDYRFEKKPKYTIAECKEQDATYALPLRVKARLSNLKSAEIKEQEIYMGDFPLMTENGTFIINGAERVIVSQLVRSPGVYYDSEYDKTGKKQFTSTVIPNRGAWIEYETDPNDMFYVRLDKNRKAPVTVFIKALLRINDVAETRDDLLTDIRGTESEIYEIFGDDERILKTLQEKDGTKSGDEALLEIYRRLRPGEPPTLDSAVTHIKNLFFDSKRYDLSRVGRYKYNKKLALSARLAGLKLAEPVIDELTGELLAEAGHEVSKEEAQKIENAGVNAVYVEVGDKKVKILSNNMVDITEFVDIDPKEYGINEKVRFGVLRALMEKYSNQDKLKRAIADNVDRLVPMHIVKDDIFASINYISCLSYGIGSTDDIDHLGNRRIKSVGELLQNQFRTGFARMERVVRERMTLQAQDLDVITPQALINIRPIVAAIKEFFGSSPLSQFMDQTNPLSELTHKRRLSALGPGGLSRERAGFEVRDVHYSHYGRMCPIETPEGANIGLISYLASFARLNDYGFIEAPYRKVDKKTGKVTDEVIYMSADFEEDFVVAQANEPLTEDGRFKNKRVKVRYKDQILEVDASEVDFIDVSPKMVVSVATALIPFLENDDANRALMGANMQRQAVPLLKTEAPIVGTGMEYKAAVDSGVMIIAKDSGEVVKADCEEIIVKGKDDKKTTYKLLKFIRSNQSTCVNQRPLVQKGDKVKKGEVLADGSATDQGELSLGKNVLVGFMSWEGYNYEDAVLINERMVRDDVYTSIHIEEYECEARDTKLGPEEITKEIPNIGEDVLKDLDENGIIRVGAEVRAGDILVGKVTPKGETELTAEERLLRAIFGEKTREVRDTSLRVPHGEYGIVQSVKVFTRANCEELSPGVNMVVRCYIVQKRKISVGDKMAGRHGNKGVVSRILPQEDMPFLPDGRPLDIVLNPLGVPSRMNIGQVLEVHLGMAAKSLGWKIMTPVFDGARESNVRQALKQAGLREDGKTVLCDGRTGEPFDNPVTVGYMYFLKLHHLVDDKIHARSTGPYSLVTQQPLGGKAQFGGQRFGEMEVWALEAYGAAYTLQEVLTVKSDDTAGRVKTYEAIVKGKNIPSPGAPEAFRVLIKELQSLALNINILDKDGAEIDLKAVSDDDSVGLLPPVDDSAFDDISEGRGGSMNTTVVIEEEDDSEDDDEGLNDNMADDGFNNSEPEMSDLEFSDSIEDLKN